MLTGLKMLEKWRGAQNGRILTRHNLASLIGSQPIAREGVEVIYPNSMK